MPSRHFARQYEDRAFIPADPSDVFAYVDDPARLSSHMNTSSWMMGGGRMSTRVDAERGRKIGSRIRMKGNVFGMTLSLDEVITHREPPREKSWETVGTPALLVIGHYRMNVKITPKKNGSTLRASIEYDLPIKHAWLGKLLGGYYAAWCVQQIVKDTRKHFAMPA
ncbi:SRPBCC family protein [Patescibacteria group bacterium]|uniref:SRPBCC family protein n=1 Tax=candidate division WWE3 bacterium TaxID=2053526 RepID=A0A928TU05_UNCKA|nr:SRPBCC family protein [candidate division WWE3 bacterium]MCL4733107.1 SRPBCC family protein [Patescibacteria group bacterium]MDL1953473.1 SRPBCC family protein [Candidatus Uhrbacteria bacterium UHB]RIL00478.1 MAG: polyketide cyclase [Candidatus Uhrbacteria bacterium]